MATLFLGSVISVINEGGETYDRWMMIADTIFFLNLIPKDLRKIMSNSYFINDNRKQISKKVSSWNNVNIRNMEMLIFVTSMVPT